MYMSIRKDWSEEKERLRYANANNVVDSLFFKYRLTNLFELNLM